MVFTDYRFKVILTVCLTDIKTRLIAFYVTMLGWLI